VEINSLKSEKNASKDARLTVPRRNLLSLLAGLQGPVSEKGIGPLKFFEASYFSHRSANLSWYSGNAAFKTRREF
jgi:hypothetical protein